MNPQLPLRAIALSVMFASGCQAPVQLHQLKTPLFAMGQADPSAPAQVIGQASLASGQLTVRFDGALSRLAQGRRIQATVADVEKVVVTVTPQGATPVSKTVLKTAITGGQTSVTFDGLPPGNAAVTISAFDAAGVNIGSTSQQATITAGQVASLDIGLQLSPTYVPSGGSGGSSNSGAIATNIQLLDGLNISASGPEIPTHAGSYNQEAWGTALAIDAQGNAWVGSKLELYPDDFGRLVKYSPSGEVLVDLAFESAVMDLAIDPQGDIWMATEIDEPSGDHMFRLAPDGTIIESFAVVSGMKAIAMDMTGWPWVSNHGAPQRFKPGQRTPIEWFNFYMNDMTVDLSVDSHGHVWLVSDTAVECYQADGTRLTTFATSGLGVDQAFASCAITVDVGGDVWAIDSHNVLRKFNHAGVKQGEWPGYGRAGLTTFGASSQRLMPDPRGGVWVRSQSTLTRLDAAGQVVTTFTFSADKPAGGLAVDASGLWMSYGGQVHRFTF